MVRKRKTFSIRLNGEILISGFVSEVRDGAVLGSVDSPKHLTIINDRKEGLHFHTKEENTGQYENIELVDTLKEYVNNKVLYSNIEEFRLEYQEAFITYWNEKQLEPSQIISPDDPNHFIFDLDSVFEGLKSLFISLFQMQVKIFNFEEVPIGDTLFVVENQNKQNHCFYLQRLDEDYWELMDITILYEGLTGLGNAFTK